MGNSFRAIFDEIKAMMSGHFIPYHKAAIGMAVITAAIFSILFNHSVVLKGKIAVIDLDGSHYSTNLINKINSSPYIEVTNVIRSPVNPQLLTSRDRNVGVLYIPQGLEKSLIKGDKTTRLGYFIDDSNEAQNAETLQNLQELIPELSAEFSVARVSGFLRGQNEVEAILNPMQLVNRHLYNPTKNSTTATVISFVYFFSSITFGLTTLMIIGRLKSSGQWQREVLSAGPFTLMSRIVPYAFIYTTVITTITALLIIFGQLRFAGNYLTYVPSIFMTGIALGLLAFILSWNTTNPGQGASRMIFLVPPGFIMGGATMAIGVLPVWAYYLSHLFPLVWQYKFWRDVALRGNTTLGILSIYGFYLLFITTIAFIIVLLFKSTQKKQISTMVNNVE